MKLDNRNIFIRRELLRSLPGQRGIREILGKIFKDLLLRRRVVKFFKEEYIY